MATTRKLTKEEEEQQRGDTLKPKVRATTPGGTTTTVVSGPQHMHQAAQTPTDLSGSVGPVMDPAATAAQLQDRLGTGVTPSEMSGSVGALPAGYDPFARGNIVPQYYQALQGRPERTESERTAQAYSQMMGAEATRPAGYTSDFEIGRAHV